MWATLLSIYCFKTVSVEANQLHNIHTMETSVLKYVHVHQKTQSIKGHLCTHSHDFFSSLLSIINIHITKQHTKLSCKYMNWTLLLSYFSGCQWAVWMLIMREVPWCSGWWVCKVPNPEGTSSAWPFCGPLLGHSCVPQCGQDHGKWPVQAWQEEQGCFACLWRLR